MGEVGRRTTKSFANNYIRDMGEVNGSLCYPNLFTGSRPSNRGYGCHLLSLGFQNSAEGILEVEGRGKDVIRALHSSQRNARREANRNFLVQRASALIKHFASGSDIEPANISPRLERISAGTWQSDLFRLASMTWSVPVSNGFGRRLRYLVWDENNGKLIGLIAIGDPVFNLSVRDNLIGWNSHDRRERLVNIMDAYVLGALPPYNVLLGGKMVACLIRTQKIYKDFMKTYGATIGIISQKQKKARLLAVTTTSSMGRSSVYNRLKLGGTEYFRSIGYTKGWGHFHIPEVDSIEFKIDVSVNTERGVLAAPILARTAAGQEFIIALSGPLATGYSSRSSYR